MTASGPVPGGAVAAGGGTPVDGGTGPAAEALPTLPAEALPVLALLRGAGPSTRAELAEASGLGRSTLAQRLDRLLAAGLVGPAGEGPSTGGRPPARLELRPRARLVLAVELGATHGAVGLADLTGSVLASVSRPLRIADGPGPVLDWVAEVSGRLLAGLGRPGADVLGTGVGLPGPVEHATGRPVRPPIMPGWDGADVPGEVAARLARHDVPGARPVLVDNDVNLLALGEHALAWPSVQDLLYVKVATGIGAGVVSGGMLQRGAQGSAGDLGRVRVVVPPAAPRAVAAGCDVEGTVAGEAELEAVSSGAAVAARLRGRGLVARGGRDVVALLRAGEPAAVEEVRRAGVALGGVLATCVSLLNPAVVVLGGSLSLAGEDLVAGVREAVAARSTPLATRDLVVTTALPEPGAGLRGAALLVLSALLGPPRVAAGPAPADGAG